MTAISLIPTEKALPVSIRADWAGSRTGAMIGLTWTPAEELQAIVITEIGEMIRLELNEFIVDWRYDPETDQWSGLGSGRSVDIDQEG